MIKKLLIALFLISGAMAKTTFMPDENRELITEEKTPEIEYKSTFFKMIISLIALIGFGALTVYMLKKMAKSRMILHNEKNQIKVIEKRVLSPKSMLYLIEYQNEKILITESHLDIKVKKLN